MSNYMKGAKDIRNGEGNLASDDIAKENAKLSRDVVNMELALEHHKRIINENAQRSKKPTSKWTTGGTGKLNGYKTSKDLARNTGAAEERQSYTVTTHEFDLDGLEAPLPAAKERIHKLKQKLVSSNQATGDGSDNEASGKCSIGVGIEIAPRRANVSVKPNAKSLHESKINKLKKEYKALKEDDFSRSNVTAAVVNISVPEAAPAAPPPNKASVSTSTDTPAKSRHRSSNVPSSGTKAHRNVGNVTNDDVNSCITLPPEQSVDSAVPDYLRRRGRKKPSLRSSPSKRSSLVGGMPGYLSGGDGDSHSLVINSTIRQERELRPLPTESKKLPPERSDPDLDEWIESLGLKDPDGLKETLRVHNVSLLKMHILTSKDLVRFGLKQGDPDFLKILRALIQLKEDSVHHPEKYRFGTKKEPKLPPAKTSSGTKEETVDSAQGVPPTEKSSSFEHLPKLWDSNSQAGRIAEEEHGKQLTPRLERVGSGSLVNHAVLSKSYSASDANELGDSMGSVNMSSDGPKFTSSNEDTSVEPAERESSTRRASSDDVSHSVERSNNAGDSTRRQGAHQVFVNDPSRLSKVLSSDLARKDALQGLESVQKRLEARQKEQEEESERVERMRRKKQLERDKLAARHSRRQQEKLLKQLEDATADHVPSSETVAETSDNDQDGGGQAMQLVGSRVRSARVHKRSLPSKDAAAVAATDMVSKTAREPLKQSTYQAASAESGLADDSGFAISGQSLLKPDQQPDESTETSQSDSGNAGSLAEQREKLRSVQSMPEGAEGSSLYSSDRTLVTSEVDEAASAGGDESGHTSASPATSSTNDLLHQLEEKLEALRDKGSSAQTIRMVEKMKSQILQFEKTAMARREVQSAAPAAGPAGGVAVRSSTTAGGGGGPSRTKGMTPQLVNSRTISQIRTSIAEQDMVKNLRKQQTQYKQQIKNLEQELKRIKEYDPIRSCELNRDDLHFGENDRIGDGAFAEVFYGTYNGSEVAVKRIKNELSSSDESYFNAEVSLLRELRHPNVVLLLGVCRDEDGRSLMVLEYMATSLYDFLHDTESAGLDHVAFYQISKDMAVGMNFLHKLKPPVLHLDLKSMNVLLDSYGRAKIADFGFSKLKSNTDSSDKLGAHGRKGSPAWMAPECINKGSVSTKSDVYSFGIILWEMLTRDRPYEGMSLYSVLDGVVKGLRPIIPGWVPSQLQDLLNQCWHQHATTRPSFETIIDRLESLNLPDDWKSLLDAAGVPRVVLENAEATRSILEFVTLSINLSDIDSTGGDSSVPTSGGLSRTLYEEERQLIDLEVVSALEMLTRKEKERSYGALVPPIQLSHSVATNADAGEGAAASGGDVMVIEVRSNEASDEEMSRAASAHPDVPQLLQLLGEAADSKDSLPERAKTSINIGEAERGKHSLKNSRLAAAGGHLSADVLQQQIAKLRPTSAAAPHPSQLADLAEVRTEKLNSITEIIRKALEERREQMAEDEGENSVHTTSDDVWRSELSGR